MKNPDILQKLTNLTGCAGTIGRTFDLMAICEDEITKAERRTKDLAARERVHDVFKSAIPGALIDYTDTLYRSHVRELCVRAAKKEDMTLATKAECVVALCRGSLIAPLDQQHTALYEHLFHDIFGHYVGCAEQRVHEPYKNATSELLHTMRRKFANQERKG